MKEKVVIVGKNKNLVGVLSESLLATSEPRKPSVLILNAGLVHRAGPFRMNVELSREITKLGFDVLRVDISGIGDSDKVANDSRSYEQRNLDDISEFIKYLYFTNNAGVVVIGLCTGADHSHRSAVLNKEVVGTVLFDGYGYPTPKFYWKRYAPILLSFTRALNVFKKILKRVFRLHDKGSEDDSGVDAFYWKLPPKEEYIRDLEQLGKRNVKQYYIYTGGVAEYYNYKEQFEDGFGAKGLSKAVSVEYYDKADHTYSLRKDREKMFADVEKWLVDNFGVEQSA